METVKTVVRTENWTMKKGGTTHLINKDLPLSYLRVKKSNLKYDEEGAIVGSQSTSSGFPLLEVKAQVVDTDIDTTVKLYGDSIPGLLELDHVDDGDELHFCASFDSNKAKWSTNIEQLEKNLEVASV